MNLAAIALGVGGGLVGAALLMPAPLSLFPIAVATLPLQRTFAVNVGFVIKPFFIIFVVLFGLMVLVGQFRIAKTPLTIPLVTFLGVLLLSLIAASAGGVGGDAPALGAARGGWHRSFVQLGLWAFMVLVFLVTVQYCSTPERLRRLVTVFVVSGTIVALYALYQVVAYRLHLPFQEVLMLHDVSQMDPFNPAESAYLRVLDNGQYRPIVTSGGLIRVRSTFIEPSYFANYLVAVLPVGVALFFSPHVRRRHRRWLGVAVLVMLAAWVMTFSKGGWVAGAVALAIVWLCLPKRPRLKLAMLLLTAALVAILVIMKIGFYPGMQSKSFPMEPGEQPYYFYIASGTQTLWEADQWKFIGETVSVFADHPLFGVGVGNLPFYLTSVAHKTRVTSATSLWGLILAESGLIGITAFGWFLVRLYGMMVSSLVSTRGTPWYPYLVGFFAGLTGLLVNYSYFGDRPPEYFWLILGLAVAAVQLAVRFQTALPDGASSERGPEKG